MASLGDGSHPSSTDLGAKQPHRAPNCLPSRSEPVSIETLKKKGGRLSPDGENAVIPPALFPAYGRPASCRVVERFRDATLRLQDHPFVALGGPPGEQGGATGGDGEGGGPGGGEELSGDDPYEVPGSDCFCFEMKRPDGQPAFEAERVCELLAAWREGGRRDRGLKARLVGPDGAVESFFLTGWAGSLDAGGIWLGVRAPRPDGQALDGGAELQIVANEVGLALCVAMADGLHRTFVATHMPDGQPMPTSPAADWGFSVRDLKRSVSELSKEHGTRSIGLYAQLGGQTGMRDLQHVRAVSDNIAQAMGEQHRHHPVISWLEWYFSREEHAPEPQEDTPEPREGVPVNLQTHKRVFSWLHGKFTADYFRHDLQARREKGDEEEEEEPQPAWGLMSCPPDVLAGEAMDQADSAPAGKDFEDPPCCLLEAKHLNFEGEIPQKDIRSLSLCGVFGVVYRVLADCHCPYETAALRGDAEAVSNLSTPLHNRRHECPNCLTGMRMRPAAGGGGSAKKRKLPQETPAGPARAAPPSVSPAGAGK